MKKPSTALAGGELPPEVVLRLLQVSYGTDIQLFLRLLRTCRTWYELGRGLLWRDIYVDYASDMASCLVRIGHAELAMIRSITVDVSRNNLLALLASTLHRMPKLETVSFNTHLLGGQKEGLLNLCTLLNSVPRNVKHLAICGKFILKADTNMDYSHPCSYLKRVLPQLERLHIEAVSVCSEVLTIDAECPNLKELTIILHDWLSVPDDHGTVSGHSRRRERVQGLITCFEKAQEQHLFPRLASATISGIVPKTGDASKQVFSCVYTFDLMKKRTIVWPIEVQSSTLRDMKLIAFIWLRYQREESSNVEDLVDGTYEGILKLVTGDRWLLSFDTSIRLPSELTKSRDTIKFGTMDKHNLAKKCESYKKDPKGKCLDIWFWEDVLGERLIEPQFLDGIFFPDLPLRRQPAKELSLKKLMASQPELTKDV